MDAIAANDPGRLNRDFCYLAFDEYTEPEYDCWICVPPYDEAGVLESRLGQIVGEAAETDDEYLDRSALVANVVPGLIEAERGTVAQALVKGFGNISSLFVSLWRSKDNPREPVRPPSEARGSEDQEEEPISQSRPFSFFESDDYVEAVPLGAKAAYELEDDDIFDEHEGYETDDQQLNDVGGLTLRAFSWPDEGCPSVFRIRGSTNTTAALMWQGMRDVVDRERVGRGLGDDSAESTRRGPVHR